MKKYNILFAVCTLLVAATCLLDFVGMAFHVRGGEHPPVFDGMLVAGDGPGIVTGEFSIIREFIGYVREAGVPGLLIVVIYFLWTERKERFCAIDQRLGTLEKSSEEILKRQQDIEQCVSEVEEGLRESNRIAQWAFERDHQMLVLLLKKLNLSEQDIRGIEENVQKAMTAYGGQMRN